MNAIQKFAVAVLVAVIVFLVGGCVAMIKRPDPNRPFLDQPAVPVGVQHQLVLKNIQEIPVYVSSRMIYYDASKYIELAVRASKMTEEEKLKVSWVKEFPTILLDPPVNSSLVTNAAKVVKEVREAVKERGLIMVDIPCQECLIVLLDYAEHWKIEKKVFRNQRTLFVFARARLYYKGDEVAVGYSDGVSGGYVEGMITFPGVVEGEFGIIGKQTLDFAFRALNLNVASWRQRLSAAQ